MNIIKWIEEWYNKNCDDDWEHCYGIKIENLDNPGWLVDIDLEGTGLEDKVFNRMKVDRTEDDWVYCKVENKKFIGDGGPFNLEEILTIFKEWVEKENL